jgi:hypothetical protein
MTRLSPQRPTQNGIYCDCNHLMSPRPRSWWSRRGGVASVALGGTGHSHLTPFTADDRWRTVIDPLNAALAMCLAAPR